MPDSAQDDGPALPDFAKRGDALRLVLPSEALAVRRAIHQLRTRLGQLHLNVEENGTLQIVLAEALNNIVEHAYAGAPGTIEVEVERSDSGLKFKITDSGAEMPEGQVPLGRLGEYPSEPEQLPEGGFGWFLIHDLTHELDYQRLESRNVLRFKLALGAV